MQEIKPLVQDAVSEPSKQPTSLDQKTVEKMIQDAKNDVIDQANSKIAEQMQKSQDSFITIFGIFASVLSFLTIEFQFLRTLTHIEQVIGFSLLLFALLLGFNLALDYLATRRFNRVHRIHCFFMLLIVVAFGLGLFFMGRVSVGIGQG